MAAPEQGCCQTAGHTPTDPAEPTDVLFDGYSAANFGRHDAYEFRLRSEADSARRKIHYVASGDYRQPTSIAFISPRLALISTCKSGEIYALDLNTRSITSIYREAESSWGKLIVLSRKQQSRNRAAGDQEHDHIAVVERQRNEVVVFRMSPDLDLQVVARLSAPGLPNDVQWDGDQDTLYASAVWAQRLYRWSLPAAASSFEDWLPRQQLDLPMCGGRLLILPLHQRILVVDAFGRDFSVVHRGEFRSVHQTQLYGHNVAELATTADESLIFFPHQLINEYARTVKNDITWGGMMSNNLRWLRTERVLEMSGEEMFKKGRFYPLGTPGNGAGDPSSMAVSSTGRIAVTLGGTNRVAIGDQEDYYFRQLDVGYRPVDCEFSPDGRLLLVVNQFSDSLSLVDLDSLEVQPMALGDIRPPTEVERGEQLFFNARLSHDGWMSCHSCHSHGHTSGQLNDNFSDGTFGTPKRILSLLGQADTAPYAWAGSMENLEAQARQSILSTMASDADPSEAAVQAIAAYIRSLPAPPSLVAARAEPAAPPASQRLAHRGQRLFHRLGCSDCHTGQYLTSAGSYDVGMHDEEQLRHFNPPSLIAVSQRQNALLHDARAQSIRDVIEKEQHQLTDALSADQIEALVAYLQSL